MIVKNEAHIIADTLHHLWKYIQFDYWLISDTGSTDQTREIVKAFFAEKGVPGELQEEPWRDFGYNRTKAFEGAYGKADYAFVWDADDEISGDFKMPADLTADSYKFVFGNAEGMRYSRGQLFSMKKRWCYKGVLHEYADCLEPAGPMVDVVGDYFFISGRRGDRSKDPNKYLKDALILEKASEKALAEKDPLYNRYIFYCAQSYNSCNMREKAIEFYKKALTLPLWIQEKYVSCMEIYDKYDELGKPEEGLYYLIESYKHDSTRLECFYRLIKYYCIHGPTEVAYAYYTVVQDFYENHYDGSKLGEKLFAKKNEYDFFLPYYMIIVAERSRHLDTCAKMYEAVFKHQYAFAGEWWVRNLIHNMQFCLKELPEDLGFVNNFFTYMSFLKGRGVNLEASQLAVVNKMIHRYKNLLGSPVKAPFNITATKPTIPIKVMLTMTSCKRWDLFEKTVNSLLHMWTDIEKVDYFFCVDDNSSQRDRSKMRATFPFIDFYMKRQSEKGHRSSMNVIYDKLNELKPTFWIHMEDDWLFYQKDNYVQKSIDFLDRNEAKDIHQILYNRNYAETYEGWTINGGEPIEGSPGFLLHVKSDSIPGQNCGYWPHYSFRPSMIRTRAILSLGNYDSPNTFFERDYADKYFARGYKSAFFDTVCCLHTGKLTSDKTGTNAYTLNKTGQFNGDASIKKQQASTFIVNLLRRTDRKEAMEVEFEKAGLDNGYEFFEAVDGKELTLTDEINTLFLSNDFGSRKGVIGCALSHYTLWKQLVASDSEYYTIFEDDIKLCDGFKAKWEHASSKENLAGTDISFLGYHVREVNKSEILKSLDSSSGYRRVLDSNIYIGGFYAYIITRAGAKKMLDYIDKNGIKHGIDYLVKVVPAFVSYNCQPHIVFSDWVVSNESKVDTDIQKDYSSLQIKPKVDEAEWIFHEGVDSGGSDIRCVGRKPVAEIMAEASADKRCIAFNTLGFLKSDINGLERTPYIHTPGSGIYVRNSYLSSKKSTENSNYWIAPYLCGGLGNRLFQISAALGLAEKMGRELVFYKPMINNNTPHKVDELYAMFPEIRMIEAHEDVHSIREAELENYSFKAISSENIQKNIVTRGYWQNYKYLPESGLNPVLTGQDLYSKYGLDTDEARRNSWFIHVRLGDYKNNGCVNHITVDSYYKKVLDQIPTASNLILFSDEPVLAENMLKGHLNDTIQLRICNEKNELVTLGLMSQCWGGAIVPNSTFSWWGAYFARRLAVEHGNGQEFKAFFPLRWGANIPSRMHNNCNPPWAIGIENAIDRSDSELWDFYEGVDSGGADIRRMNANGIDNMKIVAETEMNCVAFNTLGFLKKRVKFPLVKSPWLHAPNGLYVKKGYKPSIRIKMLCNWCSSEDLCKEWLKMTKSTSGKYKWNDLEITWSDEDIDYYVIINKPRDGDKYIAEKSIIYHMEPWCAGDQNWGVKTWGEWARPDPKNFLQVRTHDKFVNTVFWQLNLTYNQLQTMDMVSQKKLTLDKVVSSICSSKYFDPGHKKRIDFLKYLEEKGFPLHIYNEDNQHGFKSYQGKARPSVDKEKGLVPYKYYFMCENNAERNFVTEKLWEPILCESLCFYWGCPNVADIVDPRAYVQLDMNDFESAYNTMNAAIQMNLWEERLPYIKAAKQKILENSFFPTLEKVLKPKTVCFIHSCHLPQSGTEKLDLILDAVLKVKDLDVITINNIGLKLDNAKYEAMDPRIIAVHCSDNPLEFELPTLRLMHEFSLNSPNTKVLYVHTKGISYPKGDSRYEPGLDWINYMLHFLCEKSEHCLKLLDTHDVAGCNFSETPKPHFSGNFWWATTKCLKGLDLTSLVDKMSAEWWLNSGEAKPVKAVLWNSGKNHFQERYPQEAYNLIRYVSGGRLGDFIHQLSVIQENYIKTGKKGILYISNTGDHFALGLERAYADIKSLILSQEYIYEFKIHNGEQCDINLSDWRYNKLIFHTHWHNLFKSQYDVEWGTHPWLAANNTKPEFNETILFHCSLNRFPETIDFLKLFEQYGIQNIKFITQDPLEHMKFLDRTGIELDVYNPTSLEDFVDTVGSCKLFIGCLSSPLTYALALHKESIILLPNNHSPDITHIKGLESIFPKLKIMV
jgi:GR25 family glycosyltransferase involved in LPS biosynthesis/tetratricopeptide (TPR) repeat protein